MTAPTTTRPDGTQIWEGNTERLERRVAELEAAASDSRDYYLRMSASRDRNTLLMMAATIAGGPGSPSVQAAVHLARLIIAEVDKEQP